jgi:penicillin amidase
MHAPGIDCAGGAVPGAGPFIIMGRCRHHAFSVVAGVAGDTVDVVVEQRSGDGYVYDGAVEPFERRTETFTVRGIDPTFPPETVPVSYRTETHEFLRSRHGPVFDLLDDVAYARKRAQEGHIIDNLTSLFHLTTAQTYAEADAAVEEASWSVHTVYADIEGHIAYWYSGLNPIRSIDPRLPTPGHSSEYEWAGFIPKDQNPQVVDPASGVVVANQGYDSKPVSWWPFSDDWRISRIERRRVTEALVADRVPVDNADIEQINRLACCDIDPIVSLVADAAREAVALHPTQRRAEAIAYLDAWEASGFVRADTDGDGRYDEPGIAIWGADEMPSDVYHGTLPIGPIWDRLFHLTFPDELPAFAYYGYQDRLNPTDRALRHARGLPTGVPLGRDYFDNVNTPATETWHELLVQAIDEGLATVQGRFGTSEMSAWRDPVNTLEVRTLGAADVAPVKGFDHSSYNFIVDFASATDSGRSVLPPGQGAPISAVAYAQFLNDRTYPEHFVDQVEMYENFEFKPMRLFPTEYGSAPVALTFVAPPATTNHRPHASDDLARTDESAPVLVDVLANDYDADGDAVVLSGVSSAAHGLTSIEAGKIRYSPARNFNGTDTFTYSVSDARGGTDTATVDVTVAAVFAPTSLVVNVGGPGVGSVSSDPAGIACPGDCAHDFDEGSSVVLTAAAGQASRFDGWSGACAGSASTCDVSMSAARSVGARFARGKKPV